MTRTHTPGGGSTGLKAQYILFAILLIVFVAYFVIHRHGGESTPAAKGFPMTTEKQKPTEVMFHDCPPEGSGGDPDLNLLKNRVDEGNYLPVDFDVLETLPWPPGIEREKRANWSSSDAHEVARYEGTPLVAEGYLLNAKEEGPESPNCHSDEHEFRDYHIWLGKSPDDDRGRSVVVEVTPRIRERHPGWDMRALRWVIHNRAPVRISGWLMLDPEHPDQVGKTRGTIWEIHPIMKIEVKQPYTWTLLEDMPIPKEKE